MPAAILNVSTLADQQAFWKFDRALSVSGDIDATQFTVSGATPIDAVLSDPDVVNVIYDVPLDVDAAWQMLIQPDGIDTPIVLPASGNVILTP